MIFDWNQALSFEGDSGPYIQYAYARISSILEKHTGRLKENISYAALAGGKDIELIRALSRFPHVIHEATAQLRPHLIANYLLTLAKTFNEFYHASPVLQAEEKARDARLLLIECAKKVLKRGLNLLGMQETERM